MARDFREKFDALPKKRRAIIEKGAEEKLQEIRLAELRRLFNLTQEQLAQKLNISQAAVSKMEKQKDLNVSSLKRIIEAMGAELTVSVRLPEKNQEYRLTSFSSR